MTRGADPHARTGKQGFTLLELSVVLFIIAIITAMSVQTGIAVIATARQSATQKKMKAIDDALMAFRTAYDRLPCPGDLTLAPGSADYGIEAGADSGSAITIGTGVCTGTGMLPQANHTAAGATYAAATAAEGALPALTLGIPEDFMTDGWGNKFRYTVDISMTMPGSFSALNIGNAQGPITVNDAVGTARTTGSVYALISHGPNGHGAYTRSGAIVNTGSTSADEQTNCHCTGAGLYNSAYAPTYVQKDPAYDAGQTGNALYYFDDLVTFKERWQMQTAWDCTSCAYLYIADSDNDVVRRVSLSTGIITTVAGIYNTWSYTGDGGPATSATMSWPDIVTTDSSGNFYFFDYNNNVIRKVSATTGIITTVAGNGTAGYGGDNGAATSAELNEAEDIAFDSSGNFYFSDYYNNRVRKVTVATGIITTVAGNGTAGYSGNGGAATSAELNSPTGVAVDSSGNLYIADSENVVIRKVTAATGIITTVAGTYNTWGYTGDGGAATSATLDYPIGVAVDSSGNIYIPDHANNRIRKVTASTGLITTVAGNGTAGYTGDGGLATNAELNNPTKVKVDSSGNLYITDYSHTNRIRKVSATTGIITTVAGNGTAGYTGDGGAATSAQLNNPYGLGISNR